MDTALPQKFSFILDRNLAKANCTGNRVCTSCDKVVLGCYINTTAFVIYMNTFPGIRKWSPVTPSPAPSAGKMWLREGGCPAVMFSTPTACLTGYRSICRAPPADTLLSLYRRDCQGPEAFWVRFLLAALRTLSWPTISTSGTSRRLLRTVRRLLWQEAFPVPLPGRCGLTPLIPSRISWTEPVALLAVPITNALR